MNWDFRIAKEAAKQLRQLPREIQERIAVSLQEMRNDPLQGDVRPIRSGRFRGVLRKRAGRHRIIFTLDAENQVIYVAAILLRSEKTYR